MVCQLCEEEKTPDKMVSVSLYMSKTLKRLLLDIFPNMAQWKMAIL